MRRHRARAGGRASGTPRVDPARLGEARLRSRSRGAGGARKVGGARSEAAQTVSIVMPSVVEAPGRWMARRPPPSSLDYAREDAARRPCAIRRDSPSITKSRCWWRARSGRSAKRSGSNGEHRHAERSQGTRAADGAPPAAQLAGLRLRGGGSQKLPCLPAERIRPFVTGIELDHLG